MPIKFRRLFCVILAIGFIASAIISGTLAWQHLNQIALSKAMGENNIPINIELILREKTANGKLTEKPIPGTAFYLFKTDGEQVGGRYVTDEDGKINVILTSGEYYFEEITPSVGYTFDEIDGEKVTKYPFTVTGKETETIVINAYNIRLENSLLVRKNLKNADGSELTETQLEQEFTFNITFSDGGTYSYCVDDGEEKTVASGETFKLKHGETAVFDNIPVGVLYNITETPIEGYTITSNGHRGHITEDGASAEFTNTYNASQFGSITITKEVINKSVDANTETILNENSNSDEEAVVQNADSDKEFTFAAIIGDKQETFKLKDGESKTFSNIPIGTEYVVTEEDLAEEGYTSTTKEYKGKINGTETVILPFVNVYDETPEDKMGNITITKEVIGESADLDMEFEFEIEFNGENAPENEAFKLKADESKTFENIPYGVTYIVSETNANGYNPIMESASGSIAGDQTINVKFQNVVPEEPKSEIKISITKVLQGEYLETDEEKEFEFILLIDGQETKFTLKADETKEFELPVGSSYEIRENDYYQDGYVQEISNGNGVAGQSDMTATVTNTYVGEVKTLINGVKKWEIGEHTEITLPESITIRLKNGDLLVEEKEIKPDENNEWNYTFIAPKYDVEGNTIKYTIEELPVESFIPKYEGYNITNIYVEPIEVTFPIVEKVIQGEDAPEAKFEFVLKGTNNAPMPDESENNRKIVSLKGAGKLEFGNVTFNNPGIYTYTVSELNGGTKGWTYDNTSYTVTITITEKEYKLYSEIVIEKNTEVSENIVFTNIYDQVILGENIIISGEKIWKHGTNPSKNHPTSIIVNVYGDGKLEIQKQITKADGWKYSFELPKYAEDGHEIEYAIDETDVPGYSKIIDGYDLTNVYIETPDNPDTPGSDNSGTTTKPSTKPNPNTGDNIGFWVALMIISGTMLIILTFTNRKKGKH